VGDAVEIHGDRLAGQGLEPGPVPALLVAGLVGDGELPVRQVDVRCRSGRQDREVLDQVLARGQPGAGNAAAPLCL
jgi:hypothetical protein